MDKPLVVSWWKEPTFTVREILDGRDTPDGKVRWLLRLIPASLEFHAAAVFAERVLPFFEAAWPGVDLGRAMLEARKRGDEAKQKQCEQALFRFLMDQNTEKGLTPALLAGIALHCPASWVTALMAANAVSASNPKGGLSDIDPERKAAEHLWQLNYLLSIIPPEETADPCQLVANPSVLQSMDGRRK